MPEAHKPAPRVLSADRRGDGDEVRRYIVHLILDSRSPSAGSPAKFKREPTGDARDQLSTTELPLFCQYPGRPRRAISIRSHGGRCGHKTGALGSADRRLVSLTRALERDMVGDLFAGCGVATADSPQFASGEQRPRLLSILMGPDSVDFE